MRKCKKEDFQEFPKKPIEDDGDTWIDTIGIENEIQEVFYLQLTEKIAKDIAEKYPISLHQHRNGFFEITTKKQTRVSQISDLECYLEKVHNHNFERVAREEPKRLKKHEFLTAQTYKIPQIAMFGSRKFDMLPGSTPLTVEGINSYYQPAQYNVIDSFQRTNQVSPFPSYRYQKILINKKPFSICALIWKDDIENTAKIVLQENFINHLQTIFIPILNTEKEIKTHILTLSGKTTCETILELDKALDLEKRIYEPIWYTVYEKI